MKSMVARVVEGNESLLHEIIRDEINNYIVVKIRKHKIKNQ